MVDKFDTSLLCIKLVLKMLWFLPIMCKGAKGPCLQV